MPPLLPVMNSIRNQKRDVNGHEMAKSRASWRVHLVFHPVRHSISEISCILVTDQQSRDALLQASFG
jgi:hypothetical protein